MKHRIQRDFRHGSMRTLLTTIAAVGLLCGGSARAATVPADRSNDNVLQGNFEAGTPDVFLKNNSNARRAGTGGGGGAQRVNHPVLGFTLPSLGSGNPITNVNFSITMDSVAVNGAPLGFDMVVCLMNQTDISGFTAADFIETNAAVNAIIGNGIVIGQLTPADVANGSVESFSLTGAALAQFTALYDGSGNPLQSEVWFRLSTSDTIDTTLPANDNDRFNFARNDFMDGNGNLVTRTLEISTQATTPPVVLVQPQDTEVVLGAAQAEFSVNADGQAPLAYQWSFNAGELVGETNQTLVIPNPGAAELGDYSVAITNALGATNSASATLSYIAGPITPGDGAAVEGGTVVYGVELPQAATNYTYQWNLNAGALSGETSAELVLNPVELADAGNYTVDVTYDGVTETSDPAILLVGSATNDYPTTVLADNPIAWWRLGELSGTNALDSAGSAGGPYDMVYEPAVELDNAGAILGDPDRAARFDGTATSKVNRDYTGALNPDGSFSVEAWALIEGSAGSQRNVVISWDDPPDVPDENWGYQLKATAANRWRFTTGGFAPAINNIDGPEVVPFEWTHLVGVYNGGPGTIELYVNGFASGAIPVTSFNAIDPGFPVPIFIGEDFDGLIDEVAFYGSVLSQAQVLEHYAAGLPADAPPSFRLEPGDVVGDIGGEVTFVVAVRSGSEPAFQWQKDGTNIVGATLSSLTLTNLTRMDEGGYRVLADVAGNVVTSAVGNLTVRQVDLVLNPNDDGELRNNGSVLGTQDFANIKNAGDASTFTRKAIYRFDLSSFVSGTADAGSYIQFTVNSTTGYNYTSTNNVLTLWGLNDGSSGESWDPSSITYLTAPGNDTSSGSGMLVGAGDNQVANLGSFGWGPGVAVGDAFTVSGAALAAFLNADTDNQATFYLSRTGGDPGEPSQNFILGTVENPTAARRPVLSIVTVSTLAPIGISRQGGIPEITWTDTGTLQRTEDLDGTWTDVPAATSPYTGGGATNEFFRLKE